MKAHAGDHWKVRTLLWNMPVNSKGGLERVEDLREVCASAAHKRDAAARNSSALRHGCCSHPPYSPGVHFLFLLVSKNETVSRRSLNSGAIADRLTGNSKKKKSVLFVLLAEA